MFESFDFVGHLRISFDNRRASSVGEGDGFCAVQVRFFQSEFCEIFGVLGGGLSVLRGVAVGADYEACAEHRVRGKFAVFVGMRRVLADGQGQKHSVFRNKQFGICNGATRFGVDRFQPIADAARENRERGGDEKCG